MTRKPECSSCGETKERLSTSYCNKCTSMYNHSHYVKNKVVYNRQRSVNQRRYRVEKRARLLEYLKTHPCVQCGEDDIVLLDFDHYKDKKMYNIGNIANTGISWERIQLELNKCQVLCVVCHRYKTAREYGWARLSI